MNIIEGKEVASVFVPKSELDLPKELLARIKSRGLGVWAKAELEIMDAAGKVIDRRAAPSRSFLRNFGRFVRGFLSVVTTVNEDLSDDAGVAKKPRLVTGALSSNGGTFNRVVHTPGFIRFGSGTAAVLSTDFNVQTPIATLADATVTTTIIVEDATQSQWKYEGSSPNTGGSVTVNEIAIFANLNRDTPSNQFFATAMLRDLISPGVVVGAGLTALGRYTITVAV